MITNYCRVCSVVIVLTHDLKRALFVYASKFELPQSIANRLLFIHLNLHIRKFRLLCDISNASTDRKSKTAMSLLTECHARRCHIKTSPHEKSSEGRINNDGKISPLL